MAKILCLSDIHFTESEKSYVYGERISEKLFDSVGVNKLDVLFAAMEEIGPIDLLIFCGDYIVGKNDKEEKRKSINIFIDFLERVENSPNIFRSEIKHDFRARQSPSPRARSSSTIKIRFMTDRKSVV